MCVVIQVELSKQPTIDFTAFIIHTLIVIFLSFAHTNKQQEFCYCEIRKWMSKHVFVKWYHDQVIKLIQLELQIPFTHSIRLAVGSILHAGGQKEIADERRPIICLYICAHCSTELHRLVL